MSNSRIWIGAGACLLMLSAAAPTLAQESATQPANGESVFKTRCKSCHEPATERAPTRAELAFRSPGDIVTALTSGVMAPMAKDLSRPEIEAVALFLAPGQQLGASGVDPMCPANGPIHAGASDWPTLGPDENSRRFQPNPGIRAADVTSLEGEVGIFHAGRRSADGGGRLAVHHESRR